MCAPGADWANTGKRQPPPAGQWIWWPSAACVCVGRKTMGPWPSPNPPGRVQMCGGRGKTAAATEGTTGPIHSYTAGRLGHSLALGAAVPLPHLWGGRVKMGLYGHAPVLYGQALLVWALSSILWPFRCCQPELLSRLVIKESNGVKESEARGGFHFQVDLLLQKYAKSVRPRVNSEMCVCIGF